MAQDWDNFAVIVGSAAGALTGLLFVAVSLNRERVADNPGLRDQAGQTLKLFIYPLLLSIGLVLPGLSDTGLGVVLLLLALVSGLVFAVAGHGPAPAGDSLEDKLARLIDRASPNLTVVLLNLVGACLQLAGDDGLYWVAGAGVVSLLGGVFNAWLFLTR